MNDFETPTGGQDPEPRRHGIKGRAHRLLKLLGAFILILVGTIFVVLPFVPGWPLVVVGLTVLSAEYRWARRLLKRLPQRKKKSHQNP